MTTREEIDVVSCSPALSTSARLPDLGEEMEDEEETCENVYLSEDEEKKYFCQRCLNHGMHYPRKGHKPKCKFLNCTCEDCYMVEQRRQLNNMLSRKKQREPRDSAIKGPRIRDPQCARCGAHGVKIPLRGHKRSMCQFSTCTCATCALVENRRTLMAKQIKLRRDQQKGRSGIVPKVKAPKKLAQNLRESSAARPRRSGSTSSTSAASTISTSPQSPILPSPLPLTLPPTFLPFLRAAAPGSAFSPVLLPSPPIVLPAPAPPNFTLPENLILLKLLIDLQQQNIRCG